VCIAQRLREVDPRVLDGIPGPSLRQCHIRQGNQPPFNLAGIARIQLNCPLALIGMHDGLLPPDAAFDKRFDMPRTGAANIAGNKTTTFPSRTSRLITYNLGLNPVNTKAKLNFFPILSIIPKTIQIQHLSNDNGCLPEDARWNPLKSFIRSIPWIRKN
jgi:hypothetical protein